MKQLDNYLDLCTQVYDLSKPNPPQEAYVFYRSYVEQCGGPILEPMCGSGRFLLPLVREGFDVCGYDASPQMLQALQAKAEAQGIVPKVWQGFVEEPLSSSQYGLIFIPSGSLGLITDAGHVKKILQNFYDHLQPGGVLLFEVESVNVTAGKVGKWNESTWEREDGKVIRLRTLTHESQENVDHVTCIYELLDGDSIEQTQTEEMKIRRYDPANGLTNLLNEIGFETVQTLKTYSQEESPDITDAVFVYECRK